MFQYLKKLFSKPSAVPTAEESTLPPAQTGQQPAERELQKSEQHFAQLVAGVCDYAVFLLDRKGHIVTWNAGAERIKGYRPEEIIGQHFSRFYPQQAVASGWPAHELSVAEATGRFEDEGWRVRKDGSQFWANVIITAVRNRSGTLTGFLKITRDLTDRKQAEEMLRQSEERFRLLVEGVKDYAIFMLDPQGHVATWNAGAERIKGYTAKEILGEHFSRFYPPEEVARGWPDEELRRAAADGRFEDEGWRLRKDGSRFWANVVITAMRDAQGALRGFAKVTRDLTERREAEENARRLLQEEAARKAAKGAADEITRQREQLHVTLASIGDAVIVADSAGKVSFLNPVAEALTGWRLDEAVGRPLDQVFCIINEDSRQPVDDPVRQVMREGKVVAIANHTALIAKDGREIPIEDSAAPIRTAGGTISGAVLVFRDVTAARRAAEDRRYLAAIVESSDDAILGLSLEGQIASWNRGAERLYGYTAEEIIGQPVARLLPLGQPDELPLIVSRIVAGECIEHYETVRRRKDGSEADVSLTLSPLLDAEGKIIGISKVARDITDRKRFEQAVRRSEAQFRQLADAMPQIVWAAGTDGIIDYSNRRWHEFTGSPVGVGNDGWREILHPEDLRPAAARWAKCLRTGDAFEMEIRLLDRRTGSYRWHLLRTVPVRNDSGEITRWYGTATDIDVQRRAADADRFIAEAGVALAGLVDYESTLQRIANLAVPYFADWSAVDIATDGGALRRLAVTHRNPEKVRLAQELQERYPSDLDAPGGIYHVFRTGVPEIIEEITDAMLVQGATNADHLRLLRSLELRSYICVPLLVAGRSLGVLTFATAESGRYYTHADLDLAEDLAHRAAVAIQNAQLFQALREEDRRKTEFLAVLAHELRNPLAPIRNGLHIMRLANGNSVAIDDARNIIERQVGQMVRLVDDLLDISRITSGKLDLRKERLPLATVLNAALETSSPLLKECRHEVTVDLPDTPVYIDADKTRLAQAVSNLLSNAAKYTPPGGHIWLSGAAQGSEVLVHVKDNGVGIPAGMLEHVFEMFWQVDRSLERTHGGLGIGLTLVKQLVELHGGRVEARSEGLGLGSEFVIRLPAAVAASGPARDGSGKRSGPAVRHRILVVDDNRDAADSLAAVLKLMGQDVTTAHDGLEALNAAAAVHPSVILLDLGMPKLNGYETCSRLRDQPWGRSAVIVALTGWGQEHDKRRSHDAGFDRHLVKPVEPAVLESLLTSLNATDAPL